jgi:hypothetical protein
MAEMEDFCHAIQTGSVPRSSAELGYDVVRLIEGVDESLAGGGGRVRLDEPTLATL